MISEIIELGKRIYDTGNLREVHRLIVFVGRAMLHYSGMKSLQQFFAEDELRQRILAKNPSPGAEPISDGTGNPGVLL